MRLLGERFSETEERDDEENRAGGRGVGSWSDDFAMRGAGMCRKVAASAKASPGESQIVLAQWNEIARKLIAMAEDFPEDKYDYKATPAVRSFAEQILHAAGAMYYFTGPAQGQTPASRGAYARTKYKTKADVVAYVKKAVEDGAAVIKAKGDKGMNDLVTDPDSKQTLQCLGSRVRLD